VSEKRSFLIDIWYFSRAILRDRQARRRFGIGLYEVGSRLPSHASSSGGEGLVFWRFGCCS